MCQWTAEGPIFSIEFAPRRSPGLFAQRGCLKAKHEGIDAMSFARERRCKSDRTFQLHSTGIRSTCTRRWGATQRPRGFEYPNSPSLESSVSCASLCAPTDGSCLDDPSLIEGQGEGSVPCKSRSKRMVNGWRCQGKAAAAHTYRANITKKRGPQSGSHIPSPQPNRGAAFTLGKRSILYFRWNMYMIGTPGIFLILLLRSRSHVATM